MLEKLVGHAAFCRLSRREVLAIFFVIYRFIRRHYDQVVPLWDTALDELLTFEGCMIYLCCPWWHPWSPGV